MLILFSIRVAKWSSIWERAVHLGDCACLSLTFSNLSECVSFLFDFRVGCAIRLY